MAVNCRQYKAAMQKDRKFCSSRRQTIDEAKVLVTHNAVAHLYKVMVSILQDSCAAARSKEYKVAVSTAQTYRSTQHTRHLHDTTCGSTKYTIYKSSDKHEAEHSITM